MISKETYLVAGENAGVFRLIFRVNCCISYCMTPPWCPSTKRFLLPSDQHV